MRPGSAIYTPKQVDGGALLLHKRVPPLGCDTVTKMNSSLHCIDNLPLLMGSTFSNLIIIIF